MRYASRAAVVAALIANTDLDGVQVEHCWPGDQRKDECIWLNPTEGGSVNIPAFRGAASSSNPVMLDDRFTIPVEIIVQGKTPELAESRVGELSRAVIATLTEDPALSNITAPTGWQVIDATISDIDGPGTARGGEWSQSYTKVVIQVHARKS